MRKPINAAKTAGFAAFLSLAAGCFAGWNIWRAAPEYARLLNGLSVHINTIGEISDPVVYFLTRSLTYSAPLAAMWFLAFLPPAAFLAPLLVMIKGVALGFTVRAFWDLSGAAGLKQAAALLLPQNLLLAPVYCLIATDSICQALGTIRAKALARDMGGITAPRLRLSARGGKPGYPGKLAAAIVCAMASAAWEAWLTVTFYNFFIH